MNNNRIFLSPPHMGKQELEFIKEAFETNWISPVGENINKFEQAIEEYLNQNIFVTALNCGTSAIHLALVLAGIKKGDSVLCQSFTFCGSTNPVLYLGANPILIDSETDTWNICPELLEKAITEESKKGNKPKALILVHLYGMPAKLEEIIKICTHHQIKIIEDAAESLGSTYRGLFCGTFGDYGILSFNGNKIITTSAGGALITKSKEEKEKAIFYATQAKEKATYYEHTELGFNYRMSNILAGIGRGQMQMLEERINQKRNIYAFYKANLEPFGFEFLDEPSNMKSNRWLSCMICPTEEIKNGIIQELDENTIESRPLWKPIHLQPLYKNQVAYENGTSENLFKKGICLPSGTGLTNGDLERVINLIKS